MLTMNELDHCVNVASSSVDSRIESFNNSLQNKDDFSALATIEFSLFLIGEIKDLQEFMEDNEYKNELKMSNYLPAVSKQSKIKRWGAETDFIQISRELSPLVSSQYLLMYNLKCSAYPSKWINFIGNAYKGKLTLETKASQV